MDPTIFRQLVAEAIDALPAAFRERLANIDLVVEDWPSAAALQKAGHQHPAQLLGFYQGVPQTRRTHHDGLVLPDKISLFQRPIEMRCQAQKGGHHRYYRCRARQLGYDCDQPGVPAELIDDQVVGILRSLKPPIDWRRQVTAAVSEMLGERNLEDRLRQVREVIKRMDKRWDHGFFTSEDDYIRQRLHLQQELEQLTPIPDNELEQAANLLNEFGRHWEQLEGNDESQRDLVRLIVQRVYIDEDTVVAMTLRSNYHLVLGHNTNGPTEFSVDPFVYTSGSDGIRASARIRALVFVPPSVIAISGPDA